MPIRSKVSFGTNCNFVTGFQCYHIRDSLCTDKSIVMGGNAQHVGITNIMAQMGWPKLFDIFDIP